MNTKPNLMLQRELESWRREHRSAKNEPSRVLEALAERRKALYLSKVDVAFLGDVSPRFMHDLERGKPTVQLDKVLAVASVLQLQLVWYSPPRRFNTHKTGTDLGG